MGRNSAQVLELEILRNHKVALPPVIILIKSPKSQGNRVVNEGGQIDIFT